MFATSTGEALICKALEIDNNYEQACKLKEDGTWDCVIANCKFKVDKEDKDNKEDKEEVKEEEKKEDNKEKDSSKKDDKVELKKSSKK